MHYSYHLAPAGEMCVVPGQCAPDYIDWFLVISHPFVAVAQPLDPPRDAPATHHAAFVEPHRPQVLEPAQTCSGKFDYLRDMYQMSFTSNILILICVICLFSI